MKDRVPTKPGRIQLVPSADGDDLFVLTRSDEPTQIGTPLNKSTLLSDATVTALGLPGDDPTVDDALAFTYAHSAFVRAGEIAPTLDTVAKRGDIYIHDAGTGPRRVYICNAVGEKDVDLGAKWERGSLATNSATSAAANNRVRSDVVLIPAGTKLSIASGFQFGIRIVNENREYQSSVAFRTASWTAEDGTLGRILIRRSTEDASEVADVAEFASKLTTTANGSHWTTVGSARQVEKTIEIRQSMQFRVPSDMTGTVKILAFGGGAGGSSTNGSYGGGGGHMATYSGVLTEKVYDVIIGAGGAAGSNGGTTTFGSLVTAAGATGQNGGSGGGTGGSVSAGNGTYGGGGGGITSGLHSERGGNGGTYGGGGGGSTGGTGGTGQNKHTSTGTGGAGYSANTSSANGGAGANTTGLSISFEGTGAAGSAGTQSGGGGGGGYGGSGGNGSPNASYACGGGGGYGANGGNGISAGGGGGGYGGDGGDGNSIGGGGGGGYGKYSGKGGDGGKPGGTAAGGGCGAAGGSGIVVITYTGWEVF